MRNPSAPLIVLVVAVALLPVMYALSIGPALRFNLLDSDTHNLIYGPLDSLAAAFRPVQDFLNWYLGLWGR
jgi:hypothetical protein